MGADPQFTDAGEARPVGLPAFFLFDVALAAGAEAVDVVDNLRPEGVGVLLVHLAGERLREFGDRPELAVLTEFEQDDLLERLDVGEGGHREFDDVAAVYLLRADGRPALVELRQQVGGGVEALADAVGVDFAGVEEVLEKGALGPQLLCEFGFEVLLGAV